MPKKNDIYFMVFGNFSFVYVDYIKGEKFWEWYISIWKMFCYISS